MNIGRSIGKAGPQMEQGEGGFARHAGVTVRHTADHAFEQAKNAAHPLNAVKRRDAVHFGCARIGEADIDATIDKGLH